MLPTAGWGLDIARHANLQLALSSYTTPRPSELCCRNTSVFGVALCRNKGLLVLAETLVECLSGGSNDGRLAGQAPALQSWLDGTADVPQVLSAAFAANKP